MSNDGDGDLTSENDDARGHDNVDKDVTIRMIGGGTLKVTMTITMMLPDTCAQKRERRGLGMKR